MVKLSHPNIVKLLGKTSCNTYHISSYKTILSCQSPIGVCFTDPMLLIMELCHLGPVNVFLQSHPYVRLN